MIVSFLRYGSVTMDAPCADFLPKPQLKGERFPVKNWKKLLLRLKNKRLVEKFPILR